MIIVTVAPQSDHPDVSQDIRVIAEDANCPAYVFLPDKLEGVSFMDELTKLGDEYPLLDEDKKRLAEALLLERLMEDSVTVTIPLSVLDPLILNHSANVLP